MWVFSFMYAAAYLVWLLAGGQPLRINLVVLAILAVADICVTVLLMRVTSRAFTADRDGIWLGKKTAGKTAGKSPQRLSWEQVRRLTISSYPHGSMLQIMLDSGARATSRLRQMANLPLMFALILVSWGMLRPTPELLTVLPDPPRYRVPLFRVTPDELRSALSALAPPTLPIEILP